MTSPRRIFHLFVIIVLISFQLRWHNQFTSRRIEQWEECESSGIKNIYIPFPVLIISEKKMKLPTVSTWPPVWTSIRSKIEELQRTYIYTDNVFLNQLLCPESAVSEIRFAWNLYICSLAEWQEWGPVICFSACGIQSGTVQSRCFALRIQQWPWRSHGNAFFLSALKEGRFESWYRSQFSLECKFFTRTLNVHLGNKGVTMPSRFKYFLWRQVRCGSKTAGGGA